MATESLARAWDVWAAVRMAASGNQAQQPSAGDRRDQGGLSWQSLSLAARLYIAIVMLVGASVVFQAASRIATENIPLLAILAVLSIVTSVAKVTLPVPRSTSTLTICYVIDF